MRASIAIPGIFTPVRHDNRWLMEGGMSNPVSDSACRAFGADIVIGVDPNAGNLASERSASRCNLLPQVISGAAVISVVLDLNTTGQMLVSALQSQDMYLAGSFLMFQSMLVVVGVYVSDIALAALDPRIRLTGGATK